MGRLANENGVEAFTGDARFCRGEENRFNLKLAGVPCSFGAGLLMGRFGESASLNGDFGVEGLKSVKPAAEGVVGAFFGFFGDLSCP